MPCFTAALAPATKTHHAHETRPGALGALRVSREFAMKSSNNSKVLAAMIAPVRAMALVSTSVAAIVLARQRWRKITRISLTQPVTRAPVPRSSSPVRCIRRPNLESPIPVTSIGGEEIFQQGQNSVGDILNDLPQLRSTLRSRIRARAPALLALTCSICGASAQRTLVLGQRPSPCRRRHAQQRVFAGREYNPE